MTATLSAAASAPTSIRVRTGLALSAVLGAGNFPILFTPKSIWGHSAPPYGLMVLGAALGVVSVVCAAIAWRSGNRVAIWIDVAALIVNGLLDMPGFFLHGVASGIRVLAAVIVVGTVLSVVLMLRRDRDAVR